MTCVRDLLTGATNGGGRKAQQILEFVGVDP